jgi:Mn-dependent DtxR family transcriptional regulator
MRVRKINDQRLLALLSEGRLQKEIARELKVSEPAITKRLKRLFPERYQVPKVFGDLTEKEKRFVIEKARGKTNTEAALASFECRSRETAKVIGSQLMSKAEVRQSLSEIMNQVGLSKLYRIQKLRSHVDNIDPYVSLKALEQSWKLDGYQEGKRGEEASEVPYEKKLREVIFRQTETTLMKENGNGEGISWEGSDDEEEE